MKSRDAGYETSKQRWDRSTMSTAVFKTARRIWDEKPRSQQPLATVAAWRRGFSSPQAERAAMIERERKVRAQRRMRGLVQIAIALAKWQAAIAFRLYAPGGSGFHAAETSFHAAAVAIGGR